MGQWLARLLDNFIDDWYIPNIGIIDVLEVIIISLIAYRIVMWLRNTKAWMLLKGLLVLAVFILLAALFQMHTILFLAQASFNILAISAVVVFQPELRRSLERIGEKNLLKSFRIFEPKGDLRFSEETLSAITYATTAMSKDKIGALIVVEQTTRLSEYEITGINLDCVVSEQILLNIFENNTPLHDGAVIIRGNRITSATCYLPLSDNMHISKDLGTRHRAALGLSEVSDALVICVSEESGYITVASYGKLHRNLTTEELTQHLSEVQLKSHEAKGLRLNLRRKKS